MPGPLDGIRVLDFTIAQQGPYATLLLADMGAEVIKIEGRERGEVGRLLGIDRRNGFSAYFLAINRGKKSIRLDLKSDKGREVALRLARDCDIVAHNFRPGVMEKLGLGYEAFRAVNPRVIYAGASAFGTKGPLGRKPGNDILAQAMSGLMSVTGEGTAPLPGRLRDRRPHGSAYVRARHRECAGRIESGRASGRRSSARCSVVCWRRSRGR